MARKAKYTDALPVYVAPEIRARILRIAEEYDISQAEVTRQALDAGLPAVEERYPSTHQAG